jgi:multidrug resistance efflux pump
MTPDEQNLDMLVAELDRENRLLRARNERLERDAEKRKHRVELTKNESVSYEELEIDRDRMKTARDSGMLEIANLKVENHDLRTRNERLEREAEQRKPWVGLTDEERDHIWHTVGNSDPHGDVDGYSGRDVMAAIEAKLREKNL